MSAQALATVMGPPLMLHSAVAPGKEVDHAQPIAVLKYLLQIWPQPQQASSGNVILIRFIQFTVHSISNISETKHNSQSKHNS